MESLTLKFNLCLSYMLIYLKIYLLILLQVDASTQKNDESETFDVELTKNVQGLGITIAGYIGDKKLGNIKS